MQNATIFGVYEIDRQAALKCFPTHLNNNHGQGVDDKQILILVSPRLACPARGWSVQMNQLSSFDPSI